MRFIGNAPVDGEVRAIASGALATGDTVVVNSDGTVSVVSETDTAQAIGTAVEFASVSKQRVGVVYAGLSSKFVLYYTDQFNSGYGTAVVGTVNTSDNSITFGTPVVFTSENVETNGSAYDEASGNVVIFYKASSTDNGKAIVGSVSGSSVTFGSAATFDTTADGIGAVYDSDSQKVVISYYGTSDHGFAIVGTVSGTSISFGTKVTFAAAATTTQDHQIAYDTNAQRVVIGYKDVANSQYGTAIVGTVSGDSISFGSEVVFRSAKSEQVSVVYEPTSQKILVCYYYNDTDGRAKVGTVSDTTITFGSESTFSNQKAFGLSATAAQKNVVVSYEDDGDSEKGKLVVGTISGTTVSFGSAVEYEASAIVANTFGAYDPLSKRVVIGYEVKPSEDPHAVVFQPAATSTTLTSENFLGFAAHTYADTQSAVINSTCTVDRNQTSLTAGQKYYVQVDGALGTTPGDPSVEAGTAISSTEIIVKG